MNNKGKCRLKLYRVRVYGALAFYCINPEHDHGEHHPFLKSLTAESIGVDPEALYAEMMSLRLLRD